MRSPISEGETALPQAKLMTPTAANSTERPLPNWDTLTFSLTETDWLYQSFGQSFENPSKPAVWDNGQYLPFDSVRVSPAAAFMSYGLGVFEGLKAQKTSDGRILLFRPDKNAERFQHSAKCLLMEPFPVEQFLEACDEVVRRNVRFAPPADKGSFYLRPVQHAIEAKLGLGPCHHFCVTIFGSPVGSYFAGGAGAGSSVGGGIAGGVRLKVLEQGRVAQGGTGHAKAMGNYAGGIGRAYKWKSAGFDDVLYLDAHELRYVTETSGSNVFLRRKDDVIVTPALNDQILPGVTRDTVIEVAQRALGLRVEQRPLSIAEVIEEGKELFCTGTAWTVQSVREVVYREQPYQFQTDEVQRALLEVIRGVQIGTRDDEFGWIREVQTG